MRNHTTDGRTDTSTELGKRGISKVNKVNQVMDASGHLECLYLSICYMVDNENNLSIVNMLYEVRNSDARRLQHVH